MALNLSKIRQLEKKVELKLGIDVDKKLPIPEKWGDFVSLTRIRSGNKIAQFLPYSYQIKLSDCIDNYYGTIVTKSRQLGITQCVAAKFLHKACLNPAYTALILSKNQDDTRKVAERIGEMIHCLEDYIELETDNKLHLKIKNGGQIYFRNSTPDGARGIDSVSDVMFDEAAFVPEIDLIYTAVMPTLEMTGDEARVVILSTPNGRSGWFFDQLFRDNDGIDPLQVCEQIKARAVEPTQWWVDENGWCKFFTHWLDHPKYSLKENYLEDIAKKKKLSWAKVQQEYNLSFTDSETSVFSANIVQKGATGNYESLVDKSTYYAGLDCSGLGEDYTALVILKKSGDKVSLVKVYRKRQETSDYHIYQIGQILSEYKPEKVGVEVTGGTGQVYLEQLSKAHPKIGFEAIKTTGDSKPVMVDRLKLALEKGDLSYPTKCPLVDELLSFRREGKKLQAASGKHDDVLMAVCFALTVAETPEESWDFSNVPRVNMEDYFL